MDLSGRTAMVTGGAGHLGRAISLDLSRLGCHVVAIDQDEEAAGCLPGDERVSFKACDLTDPAATHHVVNEAAKEYGPISILVNSVGFIYNGPLLNIANKVARRHDIDAWRRVIEANLTTVFLATLNVVDHMVASRTRGVVVNLSSIAAGGNAGQGAYAAAKAGVNAATLTWAKELGPLGIRFVAIAPGFIDTATTRAAIQEPILRDLLRRTPVRRLGSVESVTSAVLFAIANEHLSGTVIEVDGGLTL